MCFLSVVPEPGMSVGVSWLTGILDGALALLRFRQAPL